MIDSLSRRRVKSSWPGDDLGDVDVAAVGVSAPPDTFELAHATRRESQRKHQERTHEQRNRAGE